MVTAARKLLLPFPTAKSAMRTQPLLRGMCNFFLLSIFHVHLFAWFLWPILHLATLGFFVSFSSLAYYSKGCSASHISIINTTILEPPNRWILVPIHSPQGVYPFSQPCYTPLGIILRRCQ